MASTYQDPNARDPQNKSHYIQEQLGQELTPWRKHAGKAGGAAPRTGGAGAMSMYQDTNARNPKNMSVYVQQTGASGSSGGALSTGQNGASGNFGATGGNEGYGSSNGLQANRAGNYQAISAAASGVYSNGKRGTTGSGTNAAPMARSSTNSQYAGGKSAYGYGNSSVGYGSSPGGYGNKGGVSGPTPGTAPASNYAGGAAGYGAAAFGSQKAAPPGSVPVAALGQGPQNDSNPPWNAGSAYAGGPYQSGQPKPLGYGDNQGSSGPAGPGPLPPGYSNSQNPAPSGYMANFGSSGPAATGPLGYGTNQNPAGSPSSDYAGNQNPVRPPGSGYSANQATVGSGPSAPPPFGYATNQNPSSPGYPANQNAAGPLPSEYAGNPNQPGAQPLPYPQNQEAAGGPYPPENAANQPRAAPFGSVPVAPLGFGPPRAAQSPFSIPYPNADFTMQPMGNGPPPPDYNQGIGWKAHLGANPPDNYQGIGWNLPR